MRIRYYQVAVLLCCALGAGSFSPRGKPACAQGCAEEGPVPPSTQHPAPSTPFAQQERLLREWVATHATDGEARFRLARVLAWQGKTAEALAEYDRLLATSPKNVDYLLGKAQTLTWGDRAAEALPLLEEARSLAPRDEEIHQAQIQARRKLESREQRTELESGFSRESLTRGNADWRSFYVEWRKVFAEQKAFYGVLRETERFSRVDRELMAGFSYPLGKGRAALLEASGSPTHRVLPAWSVLGLMQWDLGGGWDVQAGGRHSAYEAAPANLGLVTLERYWKRYRAAYTLAAGETGGAGSSLSHRLRFSLYYADRSAVEVGFAAGREVESLGGGRLLGSEVLSLNLLGRHWLTPAWAITYDIGWHRQGKLYTRRGFSIGLRHLYH
jgi:YaiO family outer membrane protein